MKLADLIRQTRKERPKLGTAGIRDALAETGVVVETAYVKLVLWRDRKRREQGPVRRQRRRPDPSDVNRSEEVRKLLEADPDRATASIQEELAGRGIGVSASLVKVVRHNWKKKLAASDRAAEFVGDDEVPELPSASPPPRRGA